MSEHLLHRRCAAGVLFVALCCACAPAAAQAPAGKSLAQAVEAAQSARLSVRIAAAEMDAASARVAQAQAQRYPTLDLSSNLNWVDNNDTFSGVTASVNIPELGITPTATVSQTVPRYQTSAGLTARYNAYTGGRVEAQLNKDELGLRAADVSRQLALQQVALDVSTAYFRLRRACMQVSSATRQLQRAQIVSDQTGQRLRDGRVAPIEERVSALALTEKRSAVLSRQEDLDAVYASYRDAIHSALPDEPALDERCRFANAIDVDLEQAHQLSDRTLDSRHEQLQLDAAREEVEVQRAAQRPQVSLYASYSGIGRSDSSLNRSFSDFSYRQTAVGLQVSFNLFDRGLTAQRVVEAEAALRKQTLQAEQAAEERAQQQRRRESSVRSAETRIDLLDSRLGLAKAQADMARQQLRSGTVKASDVEERVERELDALDELAIARLDLALANLALLFPSNAMQGP